MTTFSIAVSEGVAAVYPNGQQADPVVMHPTNAPLSFTNSTSMEKVKAGHINLKQIKITEDKEAPAAGVATKEPLGKRTGTIRVEVQEGEVMVRFYHLDTKFTEEKVVAGQKLDREVTEENKITLAVYV